jgi:very-short-patch-repair endonuclease
VNNISIEEAKIVLKQNNKSPFYKENHENENSYKQSQSRSLESYIEKYGDEDGRKRYKEHINKISFQNSLEGYKRKYGDKEGIKIFEKVNSKKDSMSLEYFLQKNDNNMFVALKEYEDRKKGVDVSIKSLISKYGQEMGLLKHQERVNKSNQTLENRQDKEKIFKSRAITIDNLKKKYGTYEEALSRYNDWRKKVSVPICRASKESLETFEPLIDILINQFDVKIEDIYIGHKEKSEFFIRKDEFLYFYDFTIRSKKIIIEFNGVLFHPKLENTDWINPFDKKIDSKTAYNKQQNKIKIAVESGFKVLEIWSDEDNNLDRCVNFIKNNI